MQLIGSASTVSEQAAEQLLSTVPDVEASTVGYEPTVGSVVSPIHRGVESACFNVELGTASAFLKVRYPDMENYFDESLVLAGMQRAAELGVGPRVIHSDSDCGAYLLDRLSEEWSWGRVDNFANPTVLENTVIAKRLLHKSDLLSGERSVFDTIHQYNATIANESIAVPDTVSDVINKVERIRQSIEASGTSLNPCHGDGVSSNVMISASGDIQLVDFDLAGNADPYWDLGSMIVEIAQFDDLARQVIEIYEGQCRDEIYNRCRLYGIVDDLMWSLWGFISFAHSPRKEVEFVKYAQWRLLRAVWNSGSPEFDGWISRV